MARRFSADAAADASDAASQFLTGAVFALDTTTAVSFASDIEYCYDRDIPWASCTLHGKLILGDDVVADATWDASWTNGRFEHARPFLTVSITGRKGLLGRFGITSRTVVATAAELAAALAVNAK